MAESRGQLTSAARIAYLPRGRTSCMDAAIAILPTLDDVRRHVHMVLCGHDNLDPAQTTLNESTIKRRNRPCGLFFQVQGPRLLRNFAVWAGDEDRILFYDSSGLRFAETRLSEGPDVLKLAG